MLVLRKKGGTDGKAGYLALGFKLKQPEFLYRSKYEPTPTQQGHPTSRLPLYICTDFWEICITRVYRTFYHLPPVLGSIEHPACVQ
jgi:hypothetical protein